MKPDESIVVRGVKLRRDPAREPCFRIVHLHAETRRAHDMSETSQRDKLHRECNNEIQSLEIASQSLMEFPEAPWELRMELARQCWDETRHARLFYRRLLAKNGFKGEFPVSNHEWCVVCSFDSLPARLAIQNRTFEGGTMDSMRKAVAKWKEAGDDATAEVEDTVLSDEVQHVRFGNQWLSRLMREDPRVTLKVAQALVELRGIIGALRPRRDEVSTNGVSLADVGEQYVPVNVDDRRHSAFSEDEIGELTVRQERFNTPGHGTQEGKR